jgi:hypothetical protein
MTMRILFGAHGSVLNVFHDVDMLLRARGSVQESAYWVSDSSHFLTARRRLALFRDNKVQIVKEWTLTDREPFAAADAEALDRLEALYGDPTAWNAIVADRRLMFGPKSKFRQYYGANFTHDELRGIMLRSYRALEDIFTHFRPDAVVTFVPADYGGYLLHRAALAHKVPFLHLKTTKVGNFVTLSSTVSENPEHIFQRYQLLRADPGGSPMVARARAHIQAMRAQPVRYEGDILRRRASLVEGLRHQLRELARAFYQALRGCDPIIRHDNHVPGIWRTYFDNVLTQPLREWTARHIMARRMMRRTEIGGSDYLFYPLTSEPEIAVAVYGRDHQNQIETLRRIGQSLPLNWRLVVKEHPRSLGVRTPGYYRKLLEIPNLWFAEPDVQPFHWINGARAISVISGYSGVEALVLGKPVLALGDVNYRVLPSSMIRTIGAMSEFAPALRELVAGYARDENALVAFFAAVMEQSIELNLYSELLAKSDRHSGIAGSRDEQIDRLANFLMVRLGAKPQQHFPE